MNSGKNTYRPDNKKSATAIANIIIEDCKLVADQFGHVYRHNGRCWEKLTEFQQQRLAWTYGDFKTTTASRRNEIVQIVALMAAVEKLEWGRVKNHEVACKTGVLDLLTWNVRDHDPHDFLESTLAYDFDATAECPVWTECLSTWFGSEYSDRTTALQEFMGYICLPHAKLKKALLLHGPGDTGKSEIIWVMQQIVGPGASCSLSVEAMDDPVKLTIIQGKQLNVMSELSGRALVRDSGFKTLISTEESVFLNPKYGAPIMYLPRAKHVIATNELPRLGGRTAEVFNRVNIIPMDRVVAEKDQDPKLREKLLKEMPGIFAWSVQGARGLLDNNGKFTEPTGRDAILSAWRTETNPVLDWLQDNVIEREGYRLPLSVVANRAGDRLRRSVTANEVGKAARELGLEVKDTRPEPGASVMRCILDKEMHYPKAGDGGENPQKEKE